MMTIKRYYQFIGYRSDMREHDGLGDWVKYEDVEPLLERIKELEKRECDCIDWDEVARERECIK